jgi:Predicted periplasmic solute-binding protein
MLKNFEKKLEAAQSAVGISISEDKIDDIVVMASIIEGEVRAPEERPIAASVFYNRIKSKMKLESCATVQYVLGERKPVLSIKDTQIDSPYNTYRNSNLPIGPICSPRQESLQAAMAPADTKYLYFVAKNDGSGTHEFSETLEQHNAAKRKYQKE